MLSAKDTEVGLLSWAPVVWAGTPVDGEEEVWAKQKGAL